MKSYNPFQLFFIILFLTTGCRLSQPEPEATVPLISIPTVVLSTPNEVDPTAEPPTPTETNPGATDGGSQEISNDVSTVPAPPADPNPVTNDAAPDLQNVSDVAAVPCIATPDYPTEIYLVQNGDTFFALAQVADLSLAELGALNCLPQASWAQLEIGQALKVPAGFAAKIPEPDSIDTPVRLNMPAGSDNLELRREQLAQNQTDTYLFSASADQVLFLNVNTNSPHLEATLSGPSGENLPITVQTQHGPAKPLHVAGIR